MKFLCFIVCVVLAFSAEASEIWTLKNVRGKGAQFDGKKVVQKLANGEFTLTGEKGFAVKGGTSYIFDFQCKVEKINGAYVNFYLVGLDANGKNRQTYTLSSSPGIRGLNRDRMSRLEVPSDHFLTHRIRFKVRKNVVKVIPVYESSDGEIVLVPGKMELSDALKRPDVVESFRAETIAAASGREVWRSFNLMPDVEYKLETSTDIPAGAYELHFISDTNRTLDKLALQGKSNHFKMPGEAVKVVLVRNSKAAGFSAVIRKDFKLDFQRGVYENEWQGTELNRGNAVGKKVYFKRNFHLDKQPAHAAIRFLGHNRAELFVNGTACGNGSQFAPGIVNITKLLKAGENVIGLVCTHDSGVLRVVYDLYIKTADGKDMFIVSDAKTKCAPKAPRKGWKLPGYDDSAWFPAAEGGSLKDFGDAIIATRVNNRHERLFIGPVKELGNLQLSIPGKGVIGETLTIKGGKGKLPAGTVFFRQGNKVYQALLNSDGTFTPRYLPAGKYSVSAVFERSKVNGKNDVVLGEINLAPGKLRAADFEVKNINGKARLTRDGKLIPGAIYCHGQEKSIEIKRVNDQAGIKQHMIWFHGLEKRKDGKYDFSVAEDAVRYAISQIEHDPDAYLILCYSCRPSPKFARRKINKRDLTLTSKGEHLLVGSAAGESKYGVPYKTLPEKRSAKAFPSVSHASEYKINEYRSAIKAIVRHFENSPYASKIIGYGVSGEMDGQWHLYAPYSGKGAQYGMVDYSPVMLDFFRKHLKNKYGSDAALQKAWGQTDVTLGNAMIPGYAERVGEKFFVSQSVADYNEAYALAESTIIHEVTGAIRDELKRKALVWVYTKDSYRDVGLNQFLPHVLNSGSGFEQYTDSAFDAFGNPTDYYFRRNGLHPANRGCHASAHLNNKIKLFEMDLRSYLTQAQQVVYGGETANETLNHFRNVLMEVFQYGSSYRFYSFWLGWYNNDAILNTMRRLSDIEREQLNLGDRWKKRVCQIYDDRAITHIGNFDSSGVRMSHYYFAKALTGVGANTLNRSGVGYETYYLRDLLNPEFPADQFDVFVFNSCFQLDDKMLEVINTKLRKKGKVLIFPWGNGFLDGKHQVSGAAIHKLTGVKVAPATITAENGAIKVNSKAHKLLSFMKDDALISARHRYNITTALPMFKIADKDAAVAGNFGDGTPAIAVKKVGDSYSVVMFTPDFSGALLRSICKAKNIHIYSENEYDFVMTDGNYLGIHSGASGVKRIPLPEKVKRAVDFFTGEVVATDTAVLNVKLEDDATRIFKLEF